MQDYHHFKPIEFHCHEKIGRRYEDWNGTVTRIIDHGSHYEIYVDSRSGFVFIVGKCSCGGFISIPHFNIGTSLADYEDYFWNNERLASMMNRVDAATVAEALRTLKNKHYL